MRKTRKKCHMVKINVNNDSLLLHYLNHQITKKYEYPNVKFIPKRRLRKPDILQTFQCFHCSVQITYKNND